MALDFFRQNRDGPPQIVQKNISQSKNIFLTEHWTPLQLLWLTNEAVRHVSTENKLHCTLQTARFYRKLTTSKKFDYIVFFSLLYILVNFTECFIYLFFLQDQWSWSNSKNVYLENENNVNFKRRFNCFSVSYFI